MITRLKIKRWTIDHGPWTMDKIKRLKTVMSWKVRKQDRVKDN